MVSKEETVDNLIMLDVEVYLINVNSNLMIDCYDHILSCDKS